MLTPLLPSSMGKKIPGYAPSSLRALPKQCPMLMMKPGNLLLLR